MEHDTANGEKNENAVSPEEVRLKQELDKARGAYAMVYRRVEAGATGISPVRLTEAREKQIRKDEPLGELAQAWNAYDNALKAYLIEIRQTRGELAERRACAHEAEELIRDKRRLRFMVAFGKWLGEKEWFKSAMSGVMHGVEWLKTHKTEALKIAALTAFLLTLGGAALVAALPVAVLQAAVPFLAYGGSVAAGVSVAVPLGIALRMWLESIDKRHEEKLLKAGKMTPEEIGQEMADRRRSVKFFSFLIALITGFGVRYGVRDAVLSTDWVGVQKGINDATNLEAQAAEPRGPRPGAPGEVTPEEQSVIDNTLRPYEQQLPRLRGQIAELEAQREDHIRRMMAQGQPRAMAEFNFDNNIEQLKYSLRRCENMIRGAREQMLIVAERPFNPRFPNILAEEGRFSIERINRAFAYFDGHRKVIAEFVRTGRVPNVQAVELSVLDGEGGRGRAVVLGQESPEGVSDEMRAMYEQQPLNLREYLVKIIGDLDDATNWKSAVLEQDITRLKSIDPTTLTPERAALLKQTIASMEQTLRNYDVTFDRVATTALKFVREAVEGKADETWLPANQDRIDATLNPLVADCEKAGADCVKATVDARNLFSQEEFPMPVQGAKPLSAPVLDVMAGGDSEQILTGPVAEAVTELDRVIMAPVKEGYQQVLEAIDLLDAHEPFKGTSEHAEWFALRNKLIDAKSAYENILGGYSRLDDELARLAKLHPGATKKELLAMIAEDTGEVRGLKTLDSLTQTTRAKADILAAEGKRMAGSFPERLGNGDAIEVVAEKTVTVPSLAELMKLSTSLSSYIDTQANIFKDMADGLTRILTASSSIATFRDMMLSEVLAFGKLAPKVQIDLDHVIELVRGGRATDAEIAAAYAKADAGMQELNTRAHAATQHYNRATMQVTNSVSEAGYETSGADGETVELGSESIDQIFHPTDCQEYVGRIGGAAIRRLQLYLDSLPPGDARRPGVIAAIQRIDRIMGIVRDSSVSTGYVEATTQSILNLRRLAAGAELDIKRILRTTIPRDERVIT